MNLFDKILAARGVDENTKASFLNPDYQTTHDPYLLPDMDKAVSRLERARKDQERITIYGDYDIDGLSSAALLSDAFDQFGFKNVDIYIPNRFEEGFGLATSAIEKISKTGSKLIVTVDCGSQSFAEIDAASNLGVDIIVTDHHELSDKLPPAVVVINPKRGDSKYPFKDLAGVGVAFKLVQAMQAKISGLENGREKWLLDLVALGTVCDIVNLTDENRVFVHFGLKVLSKTRRIGLRALMAIARIESNKVNSRSLGFGLGPRMNAAGRMETAQHALDLLTERDFDQALKKAEVLESLNVARRAEQDRIFIEAIVEAEKYFSDPVLVLSNQSWNHGIVGIVASKIMEKFQKPVFVIQELGTSSKGSGRSYGDFSIVRAIEDSKKRISKGGGHKFAGGVTLPTKNIEKFRSSVNESYKQQGLSIVEQQKLLQTQSDVTVKFDDLSEDLVDMIALLEPFGIGNPQPVMRSDNLVVKNLRTMGDAAQHLKIELCDATNRSVNFVAFNAGDKFVVTIGDAVSVWFHPKINEWQNKRSVEGYLLRIESTERE